MNRPTSTPPLRGPLLRQPATWRAEVFAVAFGCAVLATVVDTYLLDRKLGLFSGGYLAEYQVRGWSRVSFAALSLLTDVAVLAPVIAASLWVSRYLWLHAAARIFLAASLALALLATADIAVYELQRYFGDLVNLEVLVGLLDGDIREILHFGVDPALHWFGVLTVGALCVVGAGVVLDRWFPTQMRQDPGARRRTFRALVLALAAALVLGAGLRLGDPAIDRGFRYKPTGRVLGSITQWLTDVDRDGYGLLSIPADPNPFDPAIHPYALDIPGNGIDENGIGGDLPPAPPYRDPEYPPVIFTSRPDVVFVILESFRADALGAMLNGKSVTPTLDRLRYEGLEASHAYSHNGFTVQSRYHAFTGKILGSGHASSLIDDFNGNGYQTAFFSAQDESFGEDSPVGFARAHVRYDARVDKDKRFTQFATPASLTVSWRVLEGRVADFLETRAPGTPLFLHLNIQDGHFPYVNPDILPLQSDVRLTRDQLRPASAEKVRTMYLNTLANVDAALGRMLARVERATGRRPAVFVIADHGESLFDEGFLGHGYATNDAQTRIPFIVVRLPVKVPDVAGQSDVRGLIRAALAGDGVTAGMERRVGRPVFQYIGSLERPKEIAWVDADGRLVVDLYSGRWRRNAGAWQVLGSNTASDASSLVHFWERLVAASVGNQAAPQAGQ